MFVLRYFRITRIIKIMIIREKELDLGNKECVCLELFWDNENDGNEGDNNNELKPSYKSTE